MSEQMLITNMPVRGTEVLVCAVLEDSGALRDFFLYPPSDGLPAPGEIYAARVDKLHRQTDGAFLRIGRDQMVYLPLNGDTSCSSYVMTTKREAGAALREGDTLLVQIDVSAQKTKLPRASGELNLPGRYLAVSTRDPGMHFSRKLSADAKKRIRALLELHPSESLGYIVRTNAEDAPEAAILREYRSLSDRLLQIISGTAEADGAGCVYRPERAWMHLLDRISFHPSTVIETDRPELLEALEAHLASFPKRPACRLYRDPSLPLYACRRLPHKLDQLTAKRVYLKSGAYIVIEPTEAFVSIDVNSGKFARNIPRTEMARRVNAEAAELIARQLRLRQLTGTILIDFINMDDPAENRALLKQLTELTASDPVRTAVVDMTSLGIVELTREKRYPPLAEQLAQLTGHALRPGKKL